MITSNTWLYQINVTRDCNLRCTHCYIHSITKKNSLTMEQMQLLKLFKDVTEHLKEMPGTTGEIHIIGGEPTMLGADFYNKVMPEAIKILKEAEVSYRLVLVSNLISKETFEIARYFDVITTSYEPETRFPKPKLEQMWRDNVKMLQDKGLEVGVTCAVTKPVVDFGAENLLNRLYDMGIKHIHLGFFIPEGDGLVNIDKIFPQFHETSEFLIKATDWYLERRDQDPDLFVNPPESLLLAIENNEPSDDIVCPIISGSIDINWDGNAASCLEAGGATNPTWAGNVLETSISKVTKTATFMKERVKAATPQKICQTCDEYHVCRSGCGVLFNFWDEEKDQECPGFKKFIKYIRGLNESGIASKYSEPKKIGCR